MRQSNILKPFGFTEIETVELLKKCRLYADDESTVKVCEKYDLQFERRKNFDIKENLTFSVVTMKKQS